MESERIQYLAMIQEPINRMSTISAILKGFSVTATLAIISILDSKANDIMGLVILMPLIAFFLLDAYYLKLERKFRYLYNQVREGKHEIDFSMKTTDDKKDIKDAKATFWECIKSPSILWFYLPLFLFLLFVS